MRKQNRDRLASVFVSGRGFTVDQLASKSGLSRSAVRYGVVAIGADEVPNTWPRRYYLGEPPKLYDVEPDADPLADLPKVVVGDSAERAAVEISTVPEIVIGTARASVIDVKRASDRAVTLLKVTGVDPENRPNDEAARQAIVSAYARQARYFATVAVWLQSLGPDWRAVVDEALATQHE